MCAMTPLQRAATNPSQTMPTMRSAMAVAENWPTIHQFLAQARANKKMGAHSHGRTPLQTKGH